MKLLCRLSLISAFFISASAWGAACCGGGFAAPAIIAGDDKAQITSTFSHSQVVIDNVDSSGIWRRSDVHQRVQAIRIEGAHLLSDRWQIGASVPVVRRSHHEITYSGLGDLSSSIAYEYLPDWDYSPLRPKGIGFIQLTFPTGRPRADSEVGGLDSRGNGFWSIGIGSLLTKAWGSWDVFLTFEGHRSFPREFSNSIFSGKLKPGFGGTFGGGGGYNLSKWRFGTSLIWAYEDPVAIQGRLNSNGILERYATGSVLVTHLMNSSWSATLSYADQTLFGSPLNTSLGRSGLFSFQKRWMR